MRAYFIPLFLYPLFLMNFLRVTLCLFLAFCSFLGAYGQVFINEGSNKNYSTFADEDGEFPDWIELYNAGSDTVQLMGYALSDDPADPGKWTFPRTELLPGGYETVFCSAKDRKPLTGFITVLSEMQYNPVPGWNNHVFATPFYWDGVSALLINTCSYSSVGYTTNSVFNQSPTAYKSSLFAAQDGSNFICAAPYGNRAAMRPNLKLNDVVIGTGTLQNSPYDYPAPYGNWYWAARNQMIIPASELIAAGLTAGNIDSLAFDVVSTDPNTVYDYIEFSMKLVSYNELSPSFEAVNPNKYLHTNFKISRNGETVYLFGPDKQLLSELPVHCELPDYSIGRSPDSSANVALFLSPTPSATNNNVQTYHNYLAPPVIEVPSGMYDFAFPVSISNPNGAGSEVHYTLNGDEPTLGSPLYSDGGVVPIFYSGVLKAKAFSAQELPSETVVASYLLGISHTTPVLSLVTAPSNLYGSTGIFDNWAYDWEKAAYVEYFDTAQQLIFSQHAGLQIDGGAGGSRAQPQHSMRVELDHSVLGEGPIDYQLIPNRPARTRYSSFYLRNGSNYYLSLPYKDAAHVESMGAETYNYYSTWRPVTVYINGLYFGLYELREKFDAEYFQTQDNSSPDSMDILSLSYWNGSALRPLQGSVDSFLSDYTAFNQLDPADSTYWDDADRYFDMTYYNDYIIAETWAGNIDWPQNNIKIYRSNKTDHRWRFCLIDLEGSMNPFGFSSAYDNHIAYVLGADPNNPYINIFLKSIKNPRFRNYFINRYADLMNTSFLYSRLSGVANSMLLQTSIEMPKEYARWADPNNVQGWMDFLLNNHVTFLSELAVRTSQVRNHIQDKLALNGQVNVTLDVMPAGAGKIKISTITPSTLPWSGVYFDGNPVRITAIPNPGYEFAYWDANSVLSAIDTNISIRLNINADALFKAVFIKNDALGKIAFSELNYHSDSTRNSGDWLELHNYGNSALHLSGWRFSDSTHEYVFPSGVMLPSDAYLVLVSDTARFKAQHPDVSTYLPIGFSFSNTSEALSLFDQNGNQRASMRYEDTRPWPMAADGYGRTLELRQDSLDPNLPESWFAGCVGGSPGRAYAACPERVVFSEINYQSAPDADAGDWVELLNVSNAPLDLSGWVFSDGDNQHRFELPANTVLQESERLVLASDVDLFSGQFPQVGNYKGSSGFGLSGTGEALRLYDVDGILYQSMVYDQKAPWPQGANGNGYTLELVDENGPLCEGSNWQDGCPGGSPGKALELPCQTSGVQSPGAVASGLVVYPNPSAGRFTVQWLGAASSHSDMVLEVYNWLGERVYSGVLAGNGEKISLDLSAFKSGAYWVRGMGVSVRVVIGL